LCALCFGIIFFPSFIGCLKIREIKEEINIQTQNSMLLIYQPGRLNYKEFISLSGNVNFNVLVFQGSVDCSSLSNR